MSCCPTRGSAGTRVSHRVSEDRVNLIFPVPGASFHPDDNRPLKDGQQGQLHPDREGPEPGRQQAQHPGLAEHDAARATLQPQSRLRPRPLCRFAQTDFLLLINIGLGPQISQDSQACVIVQICSGLSLGQ